MMQHNPTVSHVLIRMVLWIFVFSVTGLNAEENIPVLVNRTGEVGYMMENHKYRIDIMPYYYGYKGNEEDLWSVTALFGMALSSDWQIEISIDPFSYKSSGTGVSDLIVGAKWSQTEIPVSLVWSGYISIPSGTKEYRGELEPSLYLTASKKITDLLDLSATIGSTYSYTSQQDFFSVEWSANVGLSVSDSDTINVLYSGYTVGPDSDGSHRLNIGAGFTHSLDEDLSIDFTVMKGITTYGMDWSYTLTWSYLF